MMEAAKPLLSRGELRKLLWAVFPSAADLNAFCLDYFEEVHKRFDEGMDSQSKLNLLLAIADCAQIERRLRDEYADRVARYELRSQAKLSSREQREQNLAERLRQLLIDKETLRKYEGRQIDEEIAAAQAALRRGPRLNPGEVLANRYQLAVKLGDGYYAEVWEALDLQQISQTSAERVAVKVLHGKHSGEALQVKRFTQGALRMKTLSHRHILRVYTEAAEYEGFLFFVMELICGGDLRQIVIRDTQRQAKPSRIQAVLQVGEALQYAHEHGFIHRDVKPANILINTQGNACLADFDLVLDEKDRLTQSQAMLGTLGYAAPEQLEDSYRVDLRADIYGLGRTAMFVFYGKELPRHWFGPNHAYLEELDVSSAIRDVLKRATAWDLSDRYPTVTAFCEALRKALSTSTGEPFLRQMVSRASSVLDRETSTSDIIRPVPPVTVPMMQLTAPTASEHSPVPVVLEVPITEQSTWRQRFTPVRIGAVGMLLFLMGSTVGSICLSLRQPSPFSSSGSEDLGKTLMPIAPDLADELLPPNGDPVLPAAQSSSAPPIPKDEPAATVSPTSSPVTATPSVTRSVTSNRHKSRVPQVIPGTAEVRGFLDKNIINRIIRRHFAEVLLCYERELLKNDDLAGRVMMQFTIGNNGNVIASIVQASTINNPSIEQCIAQAVRRWEFPKPQKEGIVVVTYPFVLRLSGN